MKQKKKILRYIVGTLNHGILNIHGANFKLIGFSDSDCISTLVDRRSASRSVFTLGSWAIMSNHMEFQEASNNNIINN